MKSPTVNSASTSLVSHSGSTIRLTVTGLIALCTTLIIATSVANRLLTRGGPSGAKISEAGQTGRSTPEASGPWGELVTLDVDIEQPVEYVSFENILNRAAIWTFPGNTPKQVRALMISAGMTEGQADAAMTEGKVESSSGSTIVKPDDQLVVELAKDVRAKFYTILAQWPENKLMREPYRLRDEKFGDLFQKNGVSVETIAKVKAMTYTRSGNVYFSDPEVVIHGINSEEERIGLFKSLTYQAAVMARLRLGADSDIDKIIGYWTAVPGVREKDLRPLLESVKNTPEGGTISLLYLLPPFARERLFTFPLPPKQGDPVMDCHWSALNFLNETPDDRLQDNAYASAFIQEHFYPIGKPSKVGDLVFIVDDKGAVIHSAVYIADDIVFTKNGANYAQPWMLMRIKNLQKVYSFATEQKPVYYRSKQG